jgi:hypothetical protein
MRAGVSVCVGLALAAAGCGGQERAGAPGAASAAPAAAPSVLAAATVVDDANEPPGDVERGKALVAKLQCNRCHEGTGLPEAALDQHCVRCHQDILNGKYAAPAPTLARWREHMVSLRDVPSLAALGDRARRGFIERFLLDPHDLRPHLAATMPRLPISKAEAHDLAAYLTRDARPAPAVSLTGADLAHGCALLDTRGCGACHVFSGVAPLAGGEANPKPGDPDPRTAVALAPDLRFTRERIAAPELVRWLLDPKAVKHDTVMPTLGLTAAEARDLAAYVLTTPLAPLEAKPRPPRLPVLSRRVSFDEVEKRVLRNTCRHCHSEPDYALGDGGPGNSGGFGFAPRGLNLGSYAGVAAGSLDDHGERRSVFSAMPDGTPRLLAYLLARQDEEAGHPSPTVRGMPLGLPSVSPEDLQLVESWIAQGRPQ